MLLAAGCAAGTNNVPEETAAFKDPQDIRVPADGTVNGDQPDQGQADHGDNIGKPDENISGPAENTGMQEESAGKAGENPEQAGRNGDRDGEEASDSAVAVVPWPSPHETVNDLEGVSMTIKEGTVSPTGLTVILENTSEKTYIYGEDFILEKKIEGKWYKLQYTFEGNFGFILIGYNLEPGSKSEWTVRWDLPYGTLNEGEYRILKDVIFSKGDGKYDKYWLAAEFAITCPEI